MHLDIVTPRGKVLSEEVEEFTAPGILGEFGVLPGHIPFLSGIRPGVVRFRLPRGAGEGVVAVGNGFIEVGPGERSVLLIERAEPAEKVDADAARRELEEAQQRLDHWESDDAVARAEVELRRDWAQARLDAIGAGPAGTGAETPIAH